MIVPKRERERKREIEKGSGREREKENNVRLVSTELLPLSSKKPSLYLLPWPN